MMSQCGAVFCIFIRDIHQSIRESVWLCAWEAEGDNLADLSDEDRQSLSAVKVQHLKNLHMMTLQKRTNLGREDNDTNIVVHNADIDINTFHYSLYIDIIDTNINSIKYQYMLVPIQCINTDINTDKS